MFQSGFVQVWLGWTWLEKPPCQFRLPVARPHLVRPTSPLSAVCSYLVATTWRSLKRHFPKYDDRSFLRLALRQLFVALLAQKTIRVGRDISPSGSTISPEFWIVSSECASMSSPSAVVFCTVQFCTRVALDESLTYRGGAPPSMIRLLRTILCDLAIDNVIAGGVAALCSFLRGLVKVCGNFHEALPSCLSARGASDRFNCATAPLPIPGSVLTVR